MSLTHKPGSRTWHDGRRCAECCNGDRCDDPTHKDRQFCPHCMRTGFALWTEAGRADFMKYLIESRGQTEAAASAELESLIGAAS